MNKVILPHHWPVMFEPSKPKRKGWTQAVIICDRSDKESFREVMETLKSHKEPSEYLWRTESFIGHPWSIEVVGPQHDRLVIGIPEKKPVEQLKLTKA